MAPPLITSPRWSWRHVLSGSHFLVLRSIMFRLLAFSEYFSVLGSPIGCLHDIFPVYGRRSSLLTRGGVLIASKRACIVFEGGVLECTETDRQKSTRGEFWDGNTSAGQIPRTPQKGIIWDVFVWAQ